MSSPVFTFDFTLAASHEYSRELVEEMLKIFCKKYTFQLEEGKTTEYLHYQGRFSLKEKKRKAQLLNEIKESKFHQLENIHLSPTSKQNQGNFFYVTKEDTRVAGPWADTDEEVYIPRQIRGITLRTWQQQIVDDANVWNTRNINWVFDTEGNRGKSILKTHIGVNKIGRTIPYSNDYRDIMRMVMATKPSKLYLIDLPRAVNKDHLYQFMAGIGSIKDGYAYDDRYNFKEMYFDCPNIWIFANTLPDRTLLSKDRWVIWEFENELLVKKEF